MMLLRNPPSSPTIDRDAIGLGHQQANSPLTRRKRKPEGQPENNERLSKRLSLLNLEHNGSKLYVPVENSVAQPTLASSSTSSSPPSSTRSRRRASAENDSMQLDDSKHKVYIYNLDDELSSSDGEQDDGRLLFLPDIEKHLRVNRIPPQILGRPGEDSTGRELILYSIPSSITVPEEQDSVRKAILESRARAREKQKAGKDAAALKAQVPAVPSETTSTSGWSTRFAGAPALQMEREDPDPDAMELD